MGYQYEYNNNNFLVPSNNRPVGSIADYDPLNGNWGSMNSGTAAEKIGWFILLISSFLILMDFRSSIKQLQRRQ